MSVKVNLERDESLLNCRSRLVPVAFLLGCPARGRSRSSAFTLLEILLVLGVIGLLSGVLLVGGARLLREQPATPEDVFWRAVHEARTFALVHQCEVRLRFDNKARSFRADTPFGSETYPVPVEGDFQIEFLSTQKGGNTILIGGNLIETQVLPAISFFDDGSCTPFRVQLRSGTASQPRVIAIDPWTCAAMLPANEG